MQNTPSTAEQLKRCQQLRLGTQINFVLLPIILIAFIFMLGWETLYTKMQILLIAFVAMYAINIWQFIQHTKHYRELQLELQQNAQNTKRK